MNSGQISAFKLLSLYSIDCILENYHVKQWFSTGAVLPRWRHLTLAGDIFGCHSWEQEWEWGWGGGDGGI